MIAQWVYMETFRGYKCGDNANCQLGSLGSLGSQCWRIEEHNTHIKKEYACVYHLLRSIARLLSFRLHFLCALFYNQKKKQINNRI